MATSNIIEYLAEVGHQQWKVYVKSVLDAFLMGYMLTTLQETLQQLEVSIDELPLAPTPAPGDLPLNAAQGAQPSATGCGLPPFSDVTMQRYLVNFIVVDDQASYIISLWFYIDDLYL